MIVTIDTNVIINACKNLSWDHLSVLDRVRLGHQAALDLEGKILAEYRGKCSDIELFKKWYQEMWEQLRFQQVPGRLENRHVTRLRKLGCHEPSDHVFVAVAEHTERYLVTEDSDFGKGHLNRALTNTEVTAYMREQLGLTVHDAKEARNHLSGESP
jgi:predicted nucleic acid-binding protein